MSDRRFVPVGDTESEEEDVFPGELFVPNLSFGSSGKSKKKRKKANALGGRSGTSSSGINPQPSTSKSAHQEKVAKEPYHIRRAKATAADARADQLYGKIQDPRLVAENASYFSNTAAFNLSLRGDEEKIGEEHKARVREWKLPSQPANPPPDSIDLEQTMGVPVYIYRGLPVYFIDLHNFDKMMTVISGSSLNEIAMDIECNADFYEGNTALIQLGLRNVVFLVDPFSCYNLIKVHLKPLLESPNVLKIMAGMANDVMFLFKDFGIRLVGVIDLQHLYMQLPDAGPNLPSVDSMCRQLLNNYQAPPDCTLRNWTRRPLQEPEMLEYAASDARVLLELWDSLRNRTNDLQRQRAVTLSNEMLLKNFSRKSHKTPMEDLKAVGINTEGVPAEQTRLYVLLHKWRQRYSKITDSSPQNLVHTRTLWRLAIEGTQGSVQEVTLPDRGISSSILQRQSKTIILILTEKDEAIFDRMAQCKCHNCMKYGHAAKICPYPKDPKAAKKWEKENPEDHKKQKRRRNQNYKQGKRAKKLAQAEGTKEAIPVWPPMPKPTSTTAERDGGRVSRRVYVAGNAVAALIGRNGSRIRGYQEQSGARIHIAREALQNGDQVCIISGSLSSVDLAETLVKSFLGIK